MMFNAFGGTFCSNSRERSAPRKSTALTTPHMVPAPPKMLTPPNSTAAITSNSYPTAPSGRELANRKV